LWKWISGNGHVTSVPEMGSLHCSDLKEARTGFVYIAASSSTQHMAVHLETLVQRGQCHRLEIHGMLQAAISCSAARMFFFRGLTFQFPEAVRACRWEGGTLCGGYEAV
jgi:hypothetical protein